jgi:phytoene synthase
MILLKINDFLQIENIKECNLEKSNFRFAFYLLPKEKRIAISNFYLLCSYLDNIVDSNIDFETKQKRIAFWKDTIADIYNNKNITLQPLSEVFQKYSIPIQIINNLIDGIGCDMYSNRYNTFDALLEYCYGVASVVGLACMYIFTDNKLNENLKQYAINLGYALQLTNIIRDVGEDYKRNYIYIPQELLTQFNYSEHDIANQIYNENFYALMNHLYEKAIYYYDTANSYAQNEDKTILKSAEVMKNIYFKLLQKIKKNNFHIYEKKIRINNFQKILCCLFL